MKDETEFDPTARENRDTADPTKPSVTDRLAMARGAKANVALVGEEIKQQPKPAKLPGKHEATQGRGIDLFEMFPVVKRIVKLRSFQFLVVLPNVLVFYLFFVAALFGHPMGNQNITIMVVWILWWFVLIVFMVPFGSRVWCMVCPLPFFGDWLQRRELVRVRAGKTGALKNEFHGGTKPWPKKLRNIWLQNIDSRSWPCSALCW